MFVQEQGPFDIFRRIRDRFIPVGEITGFLPNLLSCVWCFSVWSGLVCFLIYKYLLPEAIIVLAISAVAIMIDTWVREH